MSKRILRLLTASAAATVMTVALLPGGARAAVSSTAQTATSATTTRVVEAIQAAPVSPQAVEVYIYSWYVSKAQCQAAAETVGALPIVVYWYCSQSSTCPLWALVIFVDWSRGVAPPEPSLGALEPAGKAIWTAGKTGPSSDGSTVSPNSCGQFP
jgi:hypothetical protein